MASHATTSNAVHACQARQQRLRTTGIGTWLFPLLEQDVPFTSLLVASSPAYHAAQPRRSHAEHT